MIRPITVSQLSEYPFIARKYRCDENCFITAYDSNNIEGNYTNDTQIDLLLQTYYNIDLHAYKNKLERIMYGIGEIYCNDNPFECEGFQQIGNYYIAYSECFDYEEKQFSYYTPKYRTYMYNDLKIECTNICEKYSSSKGALQIYKGEINCFCSHDLGVQPCKFNKNCVAEGYISGMCCPSLFGSYLGCCSNYEIPTTNVSWIQFPVIDRDDSFEQTPLTVEYYFPQTRLHTLCSKSSGNCINDKFSLDRDSLLQFDSPVDYLNIKVLYEDEINIKLINN